MVQSTVSFRAPQDCVQYFTGASGTFMSYNFAGGTHLISQNYQTCIRQEQGNIGIKKDCLEKSATLFY